MHMKRVSWHLCMALDLLGIFLEDSHSLSTALKDTGVFAMLVVGTSLALSMCWTTPQSFLKEVGEIPIVSMLSLQ